MKLEKAEKAIYSTPARANLTSVLWAILGLSILCGAAILAKPELIRGRDLKWQEEVMLPDGRVLLLSRYQEFKGPATPFQPATESNYWLEFVHPETGKKIRYEGTRYLQTVFLMIERGDPYLVFDFGFTGFTRLICPDPPYQAFRFRNSVWEWMPLEQLPQKKFKSNMTRSPEQWREQLNVWGATLSLKDTQHIESESSPFIVDLSAAPKQALFDGRPFVFSKPDLATGRTEPRDLQCNGRMHKSYIVNTK